MPYYISYHITMWSHALHVCFAVVVKTDAVEQYTFDFGEESSALSATSLENQGAFVARQIYLLIEAKMRILYLDRVEHLHSLSRSQSTSNMFVCSPRYRLSSLDIRWEDLLQRLLLGTTSSLET